MCLPPETNILNAGPAFWKDMPGNEACDGRKQSPINIETPGAIYNAWMGSLVYSGYSQTPASMKLKNNGHTGNNIFV